MPAESCLLAWEMSRGAELALLLKWAKISWRNVANIIKASFKFGRETRVDVNPDCHSGAVEVIYGRYSFSAGFSGVARIHL